jgi:hypothetical protein
MLHDDRGADRTIRANDNPYFRPNMPVMMTQKPDFALETAGSP